MYDLHYVRPGRFHVSMKQPGQNDVYTLHHGNLTAKVLADGAGNTRWGALGARIAAEIAGGYLLHHFHRFYGRTDGDQIRWEVTARINQGLRNIAQDQEADVMEFGATLMALVVHRDGRYLLVHVGDGFCGAVDASGALRHLSGGPSSWRVTLTTAPGFRSARVYRGQLPGAAFFLASDGCTELLWQDDVRFHPDQAPYLKRRDWAGLWARITASSPLNDHSLAVIDTCSQGVEDAILDAADREG